MNEFYMEQLVPRKTPVKKDATIRVICYILTAVMLVLTILFGMIFFVGVIIFAIIDVLLLKNSSVEYEYLYLNGELDIDKIIAKQKRKKVCTINMEHVVVVAPVQSGEVQVYQNIKAVDYSSGIRSANVYKLVSIKDGNKKAILIEPNETLLKGMKMIAPRKVHL